MSLVEFQAIGAAVVLGIVQAAKSAGLSGRYAPLLAILLGAILGALLRASDPTVGNWFVAVLAGVIAGLASGGAYSGQKAIRE